MVPEKEYFQLHVLPGTITTWPLLTFDFLDGKNLYIYTDSVSKYVAA